MSRIWDAKDLVPDFGKIEKSTELKKEVNQPDLFYKPIQVEPKPRSVRQGTSREIVRGDVRKYRERQISFLERSIALHGSEENPCNACNQGNCGIKGQLLKQLKELQNLKN